MNAIRANQRGVSGDAERAITGEIADSWDERLSSLLDTRETPASRSSTPIQWQVAVPLALVLLLLLYRIGCLCNLQADKELSRHAGGELLLPPEKGKRAPRYRVVALDVLRGITICLMVFVNYGGIPMNGCHKLRRVKLLMPCA